MEKLRLTCIQLYSLYTKCILGKIKDKVMMWIIIMLTMSCLGAAMLPPDTYVTKDGKKVMKILREQGQARKILKVSRVFRIPISRLKPYPCDELEYTAHHLEDFGTVGTIDKTFTEVFTTGGKYYKAPRQYDLYCACPPLYSVEWDPTLGTQKIFAAQERDKYVTQEVTKITVVAKPAWYIIYFENKNRVEFPHSGRGIRIGPGDPKVNEMRLRPKPLRWGLNTLIIKDPTTQVRHEYEVVKIRRHNIETPLRVIDYIIMLMYESYTWVEWKVTAVYATTIDEQWRNQTRGDPCNIATDEMWGITYEQSVQWTEEICYPLKYSYMANASADGFDLILPLGRFEVTNPIIGENYDQRIMNYALNWRFTDAEITKEVLLKLSIKHGELRRMPTMIYAIVPNTLMVRFHKTFFLPPRWSAGRTRMMIQRQEIMCDRDAYTTHIKNSRANLIGAAQQYRVLKMLQDREPDVCGTIPHYNGGCLNPDKSEQCQFAVGDRETTFLRVGFLLDPWENQAHIPQGEVCFGPNITKPTIQTEEIFSRNMTLIAIRPTAGLKEALNQNLSTFEQWMRTIRDRRYRIMTRKMKRLTDMTDALRRMAGKLRALHLLFTRYQDRYLVANGEPKWYRKVNETKQRIRTLGTIFRKNEFTINMVITQEEKAIKAFYLYKRIGLMLPHLNPIKLKVGMVYEINLTKGRIKVKELYKYENKSRNQLTSPITSSTQRYYSVTSTTNLHIPTMNKRAEITITQRTTPTAGKISPTMMKIRKQKVKNPQIPQAKTLSMKLRTQDLLPITARITEIGKVTKTHDKNQKDRKTIKLTENQKLIIKEHVPTKGLSLALTTIGILIGVVLTLGMGWKIRKDVKGLQEKKQLRAARGILKRQKNLNKKLKNRVSFAGNHERITTTH